MENRAHAFLAVVFLLLLAGGGTYLYFWMKAPQPENRIYRVVATHSVGGLRPGSEVVYKGLVVGHVKAVGFHPRDPDKVVIRLGLRPDAPVTRSTFARLGSRGLTGATHLALGKDPEGSDQPLVTSADSPARLPMRESRVQSLMADAGAIADQVKTLTERLNRMTARDNRQRIDRILGKSEQVLTGLDELTAALRPSVEKLDRVLASTDQAVRESRETLSRLNRLTRTAEAQASRVGEAATAFKRLGQSGQELVQGANRQLLPRLDALAERLRETARSLQGVSELMRTRPQAILYGPPPGPAGPGEQGFGWDRPAEDGP